MVALGGRTEEGRPTPAQGRVGRAALEGLKQGDGGVSRVTVGGSTADSRGQGHALRALQRLAA